MKILVIEDEKAAAKRLISLIQQEIPTAAIVAQIDSVKKSVAWFQENASPDLVFMDIQLADGLSFEIFEHTKVSAPIIFTTAYDQYAIQAFKVNSIDYLLKPIDAEELASAVKKYQSYHQAHSAPKPEQPDLSQLQQALQMLQAPGYKNRFVVKIGEHIKAIPTEDVLYFFSQEKMTYLQTQAGKHFIIDYPLDQLEEVVNPAAFFRISRKYIVRLSAIDDIITYSSSRLKLKLKHSDDSDVLVSRDRVTDFKQWLDQ
uniref:LytTR family DNA-binding domain-containing protein n=1 Tax=Roseihalotalea indica TaxID=2867963 RepID=A0AA49JHD1_9BACT|nr:LytTR family DNA-binding domain-containing protein [Tunicatimonas sp. TK19036]